MDGRQPGVFGPLLPVQYSLLVLVGLPALKRSECLLDVFGGSQELTTVEGE